MIVKKWFILISVLFCTICLVYPGSAYYLQGDVNPPTTLGDLILTEEAEDFYCTQHGLYPPDGTGGSNTWQLKMGPTSTYVFNTYSLNAGYSAFDQGSTLSTTRELLWMEGYCSPYPNGSPTFTTKKMYAWCNKNHANYTGCIAAGESMVVIPETAFSCTPTSQTPGSNVVCTDASTNTPTEWLWMEGITGLSESGWRTSTSQNFTFTETYPATYTVKLKATNSAGSSWLNRTNYVTFDDIYSGTVRTWAYTSDCISGARIYDSDISFYNVDNSTWSNSTQDDDGKFWIDTLPDTELNIYGAYTKTAGVYSNDSYIGEIVESGATYALQLCPTQQNPGSGNTNVLVTVYDTTNYQPLPYTTVSLKLSSTGATTIDSTGSSGTASFVTTNNSVIILTASKAGYITGAKTLTTSTGLITTAKIYLDKQIVTTAPTLTAVPGGTIPTTIDPAGTSDSAGNYPSGYSNMKGQQMLDWLAANGMMLVQLCFMVTVLALFGVKFGK